MVQLTWSNGKTERFSSNCDQLGDMPVTAIVSAGFQAILYENESWRGNSVVLDASAEQTEFALAGRLRGPARSLRVLETGEILPGDARDNADIAKAIAPGGWLQEDMRKSGVRTKWWREAVFGCCIHWGVYAVAGGEWNGQYCDYAEHIQRIMRLTQEEYKTHFIDQFNPTKFDAEAWVSVIKSTGMKYLVITAKHSDGFAMYPSEAYPYDIRMTSFTRDPLAELRQACERHGIRFGILYSHSTDWEHPDAPGNDWEYSNGGGVQCLFGNPIVWFNEHPELVPRMSKYYMDVKGVPQIVELIQKYKPDLLWFISGLRLPLSENLRVLRVVREIAPDVVVNGWLAKAEGFPSLNDCEIPFCDISSTGGLWEAILTTNESYGYSKVDQSHKPPDDIIRFLVEKAAHGGNVMLNIGPNAFGEIDGADINILEGVGAWMKINGESIHGTSRSPLEPQSFGEITRKGNQLYLHVFKRGNGTITLTGVVSHIEKAYLLADKDKQPLPIRRISYFDTEISLPDKLPDSCDTVIVAEFEGELLYRQPPAHESAALQEQDKSAQNEPIAKIMRYIEERYADGTLHDLAKTLSYNMSWLSRNIKQLTGSNFTELQQKKRISQAQILLDTTDLTVIEIAQRVGYNNSGHFYRLFRKQVGCPPRNYRAKKEDK